MKIIADTHAHTLASGHAYNTIKEMVQAGADRGLEVLALTEHAPELPGACHLFYFQNLKVLPREIYGVNVLFGAELNIMNPDGDVDLSEDICENLDIVLASIHPPCYGREHTEEENTRAFIETMKKPYVNIIGHPDDGRFPVDYEVLVKTAKETNTLLELNNTSLRPNSFRSKGARENILTILELCKQYDVFVTTGSDAHVDDYVGDFAHVKELVEYAGFPKELIATTDFELLKPFLNRYKNKG